LRKEAELWIKQTLKDLELAEKIFEIEGYYIVAFLCHQALEKALKGLYILKHKRLSGKTHSLGKELNIPKEFLSILRELTPDFVISRYPDVIGEIPYEIYDKDITKCKLEKTKKIMNWILREIENLKSS